MKKLKEYSQRYEGKQIWLTEFAIAREPNVTKIVEFVEGTVFDIQSANFTKEKFIQ